MRFAVLIDYANFFISVKNDLKIKETAEVEKEICSIINSVCKYLSESNEYNNKGIDIVIKKAFVLDDKSFGFPENTLPKSGIEVKRVYDKNEKKTESMKKMNQSRLDDEILMQEGMNLANKNVVDGVLVIANDGDYGSLAEKLGYIGRSFWAGVYKGPKTFVSGKLKNAADIVLPIKDIYEGIDEGEAVEALEEVAAVKMEEVKGPRILIFRRGKIIIEYPVNKKLITIGRRSTRRHHFPQIDLTEHDKDKIVSRQHAEIRKINNRLIFLVHKNCSRGTWVDKNPIYPLQQFILKPGMAIVIGDKTGFGIKYVEE